VLLGSHPDRILALVEPRQLDTGRVRVERAAAADPVRTRAIGAGRLWARHCWRGGLADLTCFDEVFDPKVCSDALERTGADAALTVGPDWAALDPDLCGQVIRRHRESPREHRMTFTQAVPGLCGCVVARDLAAELCRNPGWERFWFATIGGLLGYFPPVPLFDLIAQPVCIGLSGPVRDCGLRLIPDTSLVRQILDRTLTDSPSDAAATISRFRQELESVSSDDLVDEVTVGSPAPDAWDAALSLARARGGRVLTLGGHAWDPLAAADLFERITQARAAGFAGIHIRTALLPASDEVMGNVVSGSVEVVSVDFGAANDADRAAERLERLRTIRARAIGHDGMGVPWIVPRLTRCDATYGRVEEFVNRWVMSCGWAALDPLESERPGERIAPLPLPAFVADRLRRTRRIL
jgi:hypothetical protein